MKKQNGITIIALTITIIVILILAGVTIQTLTGDNGILTKTSEVQFKTEIAQYKEELNLSILTDETATYANRTEKFNETEYNKIKKLIPSFSKNYENVLVVEDDKLVYKGNNENFYRTAIKEDLISDNELIDDDILQELKAFITVWKTTEDNEIVTIPIEGNVDVDIDWGDNNPIEHVTTNNPTHTYSVPGEYEISITGRVRNFLGNTTQLIGIKQWGVLSCLRLQFDNCTNLTGSIPEPSKNSFNLLYNSDETATLRFKGCTSLTGPISEKLLYNVKTNYFRDMFYGCKSLTTIPEKLFSKNTEVIDLGRTFYGCTGLTTIPERLFDKNTKITNFINVFGGCTGITAIPENLFIKNTKATNFSYVFYGCTGITAIPENLFENQKNIAKNFEFCFGNCTNLEAIPANLFKDCTEVTTFRCVFAGCKKVTVIPDNFFENCKNVKSFMQAFNNSGITNVPKDLFKGCISVTGFNSLFSGCEGLRNKEIELNIESENVTTFYEMFYATYISKVTLNVPENSTTYNTISNNNNTYARNLVINTFVKE